MADGPGKLFVVATPIGNLGDLSPRAVETLALVDLIAAEDTRVTRKLIPKREQRVELVSYRESNEVAAAERVVERLLAGANVALVTDAGTPCISDPGYRLVNAALENRVEVVAVPGPSAVTALLSISGLATDRFCFQGFASANSNQRRKALLRLRGSGATHVFYESPRRVLALLRDIAELFGDPPVAVGRELTKMHEEVLRGAASAVVSTIEAADATRGEFVVAVQIPAEDASILEETAMEAEVTRLLEGGLSVRDIAVVLKPRGISRQSVYALARRLRGDAD